MPPVEIGIYQRLKQDPGVTSYVQGRIFGSKAPKNATMPMIVWTVVITDDMGTHFQGTSGLRKKRFQFDSYASKYIDSVKTSDAVRALFEQFSGTLPDGSAVNGCIIVRDMDFPYEPGSSGYVHRHLLEVDVMYTETFLPFVAPNSIFPIDDDSEMDDEGQP